MNATVDTFARAIIAAHAAGIFAGAALALIAALAIRVLRPSATTQHALWWIVLTAAVTLPAASAFTSFGRIEHRVAARAAVERQPAARERAARGATPPATGDALRNRGAIARPALVSVAPAPSASDWVTIASAALRDTIAYPGIATLFIACWLSIAALRIGLLAYGFFAIFRMKAQSVPLDAAVLRKLRRFRYSARSGRPVKILVSAEIDVPVAVGFNRAAILLPAPIAEREEFADLDQIVMHEHAHLNRYDDVTNFAQRAFEALFWFNPVVSFAGRQIALQREIACDDSVIAQTGRAHRYATCLWRLVESARLPSRRVAAPGALFTPKQITTRIEQLLDSKRNALPRLSPLSAIALATLSAALVFTQALCAPGIALEDLAPPAPPAVLALPAIALHPVPPLAVPSPVPPALPALPARRPDAHRATIIRIASNATPEAIATAMIDAAMKRSMMEARQASERQGAVANLRASQIAARSATLAKAAAAMGTGFGLDVARQLSEKLAPPSEWPAIERSIANAKKSARREIADSGVVAAAGSENAGNHRPLGAFHTVRIDGSFDVEVRRGTKASVDFQGDSFVASHTRTELTGDTLLIDQIDGSYNVEHPKTILVYVASLEGIEINGSANVRVVDSNASRLAVHISGSGDLVASGSTAAADVTIEGSGNADLAQLRATSIRVDIEGSGDVTLTAPQTLSVRIGGSGDVRMHGTPKHISSDIDGSGEIEKI